MSGPPKRRALGRGLSALLPATPPAQRADASAGRAATATRRRSHFSSQIEEIYPSPRQPRRRFEEAELEELARSIRTYGIIQPLVVRARPDGGFFLIAGERRWRAAQRAGLHEVPVVVQDVDSKDAFERALVENLQRADLNAIEEAEAYHRLTEEFGYTQEQVAERVGKERSTVANSLRLLKLPERVRALVEEGRLSMGHARALLALDTAPAIEAAARQVAARSLSVRATEALVRSQLQPAPARRREVKKSASVRDLETRLTRALGAPVEVNEDRPGPGGHIGIRYADLDDLDRLLDRLLASPAAGAAD